MCGDQAIAAQWVTVQYKDSELFSQTRIGDSSQLLMWKCFLRRKSEMSMAFCPLSFLPFVSFSLSVCQMLAGIDHSLSPSQGQWLSSRSLATITKHGRSCQAFGNNIDMLKLCAWGSRKSDARYLVSLVGGLFFFYKNTKKCKSLRNGRNCVSCKR